MLKRTFCTFSQDVCGYYMLVVEQQLLNEPWIDNILYYFLKIFVDITCLYVEQQILDELCMLPIPSYNGFDNSVYVKLTSFHHHRVVRNDL